MYETVQRLHEFEYSRIGIALAALKHLVFFTLDKGEIIDNRKFFVNIQRNDKKLKLILSFEVE